MEHLQDIEADINWLAQLIKERILDSEFNFETLKPDDFKHDSVYSNFITENNITFSERLLVILTFVPHIYPVFLYENFNRNYFTQYTLPSQPIKCPKHHSAIIKSPSSDSFLPTGQSFLYLIAGQNIEKRVEYMKNIFEKQFYTISNDIISPIKNSNFDPLLANMITLHHNYALAFLTNNIDLIKSQNNERI